MFVLLSSSVGSIQEQCTHVKTRITMRIRLHTALTWAHNFNGLWRFLYSNWFFVRFNIKCYVLSLLPYVKCILPHLRSIQCYDKWICHILTIQHFYKVRTLTICCPFVIAWIGQTMVKQRCSLLIAVVFQYDHL